MREAHGVIVLARHESPSAEELVEAIGRTGARTVAVIDDMRPKLDFLPLEPLKMMLDLSVEFGGVKIKGFSDAEYIRYDDGELRRRRNARKRRARKARGK